MLRLGVLSQVLFVDRNYAKLLNPFTRMKRAILPLNEIEFTCSHFVLL